MALYVYKRKADCIIVILYTTRVTGLAIKVLSPKRYKAEAGFYQGLITSWLK
jgi:hypothetical protein